MHPDPMPAFLVVAVFGLFTVLLLALNWGLREKWRRIETEQERDFLAALINRGQRSGEQLLRRYEQPSRN
jgi:hypothetical protein